MAKNMDTAGNQGRRNHLAIKTGQLFRVPGKRNRRSLGYVKDGVLCDSVLSHVFLKLLCPGFGAAGIKSEARNSKYETKFKSEF
jgi:hypothetical protein